MDTLEQLARKLHRIATPIAKKDSSVVALDVAPICPQGYVWPLLTNWRGVAGAGVVLIEAAGAVGKSAAASALGAALNWPLVDAAKAQVGSYSLSGLIQDAIGFESSFLAEVASGRAGIVVDALDEAHLRAGTLNFQAFLDNVARLAGESRDSPAIVLFSRPDTAQLVRLFFEELRVPLCTTSIDFFDLPQANEFINSYMRKQLLLHPDRDYNVVERHPGPFAELRTRRMLEIGSALLSDSISTLDPNWKELKSFLGYAPVLAVLSEYLAVSNPRRHLSESIPGTSSSTEVLLEIINNLLTREQNKFHAQLLPKLNAQLDPNDDWENSEDSYSPEEQGLRLVARNLELDFAVNVPASIPASIRSEYENSASQFIADHPFLVDRDAINVVFADYLRAKAAVDTQCRVALTPNTPSRIADVGPFFFQFTYEFAPKSDDETPQIEENLIPLVLDSFARSSSATNVSTTVFVQSGEDASLLVQTSAVNGKIRIPRNYDVVELSGLLEISDSLARAFIYTDTGVRISSRHGRFVIGPFATIMCDELVIDVENISVSAGKDAGAASIIQANQISIPDKFKIDSPAHRALQIVGKHTTPTLIPYLVDSPTERDAVTNFDYATLRSILRRFTQAAGPYPSVYGELMDRRVIGDNKKRKHYLSRLRELGIVSMDSNHYYLHTNTLSSYEISMRDAIGGTPSAAVIKLLKLLNEGQ